MLVTSTNLLYVGLFHHVIGKGMWGYRTFCTLPQSRMTAHIDKLSQETELLDSNFMATPLAEILFLAQDVIYTVSVCL